MVNLHRYLTHFMHILSIFTNLKSKSTSTSENAEVKLIYLEKVGMSQFDCGTDGFSMVHEDVPLNCLFQCGITPHPDQQSLDTGKTRTRRSRKGKVRGEGGELCINPRYPVLNKPFPLFPQ